jgi:hypothetical protein
MGLGPSKCCKKPAKEGEKTPLRGDPERGRGGAKAGFSGRRADDRDGGDAREGVSLESPVDPDPGVFYAKPASKSSHSSDRSGRSGRKSRRRDRDKSRGRDERRDRDKDDTSSKRHHRRSNAEKVGEERILEYHREHPERAPLLGSSSEEEYDEEGHPVPKNWIGVCPARMQHRVWWWSVTFILCFILCAGVFLGFSHSFSWGHSDDAPAAPAPHTPAPHAAPQRAPSSKFSHSLPSVDPSGVSDAAAAVSSVEEQLEEKTEELKEEVEELVPEPPLAVEWEREAAEEAKEKRSSKTSGASSSHASTGHEEKAEKAEKVEKPEKPEKPEKAEKASSSKKSGSSALPFLASTGREEKASKASKASEASNHATSRSKASRVASKPSTAGEPRTASAKKRDDAADADAADDKEGAAKLFTISDDVDYDPFESLAENSFPKAPRRVGLGSR